MATVQLDKPTSASVVEEIRTTVRVRPTWARSWITIFDLDPIESSNQTGHALSWARFRWNVGEIRFQGSGGFIVTNPIDLDGWFVQVLVHTSVGTFVSFTGIITNEALDDVSINASNLAPYGNQEINAVGLEWLLKTGRIQGSYVNGGTFIERTLAFNESEVRGLGPQGNRTASPNGAGVYTFGGTARWTHRQIIDYLLWFYARPVVPFVVAGQTGPLDQMFGRYQFEGRDVYEAIAELIDRRRGLSYKAEARGQTVFLDVFSLSPRRVSTGSFTLPANANQATFGTVGVREVKPSMRISRAHSYDRVIVVGEPVKVMYTARIGQGLEKGWTAAQETAYHAATDTERESDKHRRPYSFYRVPETWTWQYESVRDSTTYFANPSRFDDGTLDVATQGPVFNLDKVFETQLPIREASAGSGDYVPPYRKPFVLAENPNTPGKYVYVDRMASLRLSNHNVGMAPEEFGIWVRGPANHTLGLGVFDQANPAPTSSTTDPVLDYRTMIATLFVRTDTLAKVVYTIAGNVGRTTGRDLVLRRRGAEIWYVAPDTVSDVTDGDLQYYAGPGVGSIVRDDSAELRALAVAAATWYGQARNTFQVEIRGVTAGFPVGTMIRSAASTAFRFVPIGTVVSERRYDYERNRVRIFTAYSELDVEALVG